MIIDKDMYLYDLFNRLGDISKNNFASFINNADRTYSNLSSSFQEISDLLLSAKWDDDIKNNLDLSIEPIKNKIIQCETFTKEVIIPLSEKSEILSNKLKKYFELFYSLQDMEKNHQTKNNIDDYSSLQQYYGRIDEWINDFELFRELTLKFYTEKGMSNNEDQSRHLMESRINMIYDDIKAYYQNYKNKYNKHDGSIPEKNIGTAVKTSKKNEIYQKIRSLEQQKIHIEHQKQAGNYDGNNSMTDKIDQQLLLYKKMLASDSNYSSMNNDINSEDYVEGNGIINEDKKELQNYVKSRLDSYFVPKEEYKQDDAYSIELEKKSLEVNNIAKECYETIKDIRLILKDDTTISEINTKIGFYNSKIEELTSQYGKNKINSDNSKSLSQIDNTSFSDYYSNYKVKVNDTEEFTNYKVKVNDTEEFTDYKIKGNDTEEFKDFAKMPIIKNKVRYDDAEEFRDYHKMPIIKNKVRYDDTEEFRDFAKMPIIKDKVEYNDTEEPIMYESKIQIDEPQIVSNGWNKENGKWYYKRSGENLTGWQQLPWSKGNDWFFFDDNGRMLSGWQKLEWNGENNWYYFDKDGAMVHGKTLEMNGRQYSFDDSGAWRG